MVQHNMMIWMPEYPAWAPEMSGISRLTGLNTLRLGVLGLNEIPDPVLGLSSLTCLLFGINRLQVRAGLPMFTCRAVCSDWEVSSLTVRVLLQLAAVLPANTCSTTALAKPLKA